MRTFAIALAAAVFTIGAASSADAERHCRAVTAADGTQLFAIRPTQMSCYRARQVAFGWSNVYKGKAHTPVYDTKGRKWRCKSDDPPAHVRCSRPGKRVRFRLRS
jgi:hypothetical protein